MSADNPERVSGTSRPTKPGVGNHQALEALVGRKRRSSRVHRRKSKDQTYYAKKMLTYHEANRVGEHVRELGIANFRVATVTTTPERVEQMIEARKEMTNGRGSNMFLFIDDASLLASNPLDAVWTTGKGKAVRLTD